MILRDRPRCKQLFLTPLSVLLAVVCGCGPDVARAVEDDHFYVLQPDSISTAALTEAGFHWLILEPTSDGGASGDFTSEQISQIRSDGPCHKTILAYLSVGEAEDYRDYWDPGWVDESGDPIPGVAPEWLGPTNPDWPGNYKVRYWHPEWEALIMGTPAGPDKTPLDRIIDQGFDGVYLDIIDAYEFWSSPEGGSELTRMDARIRMIEFIENIAEYARITRGVAGFLVFPQNAGEIIRDDDDQFDAETDRYFAAISGIGQEDLFYDELTPQPPENVDYVLDQLREFYIRSKTVLVTDYVIDQDKPGSGINDARVSDFYTRCRAEGFVPYAAHRNRNLDEVVTFSMGEGWTFSQPAPGCWSDVLGDFDGDRDVDLDDFSGVAQCLTGPNTPASPDCAAADLDTDTDVDIQDCARFQTTFSGDGG